jgi:phage tail sheath protein FI
MDIEDYDVTGDLLVDEDQELSVRFTANEFSNRGVNTSFAAAYWPDVVMRDEINGTIRQVPPSVPVLGAFALNDAVGFPWFAPAGFTRGALSTTENAVIPLSRQNLDDLQTVRINPIVAFANSGGPVVWGQRTLLATDSALERVNVRRLLISLRREVRAISNRIVFEPNREETLARFSALVNPVFKRVQDQRGIDKFLVRIDTTTTTQADVENRTIRGKIYLVPTRTLEFLSIDFTVSNNASFTQG